MRHPLLALFVICVLLLNACGRDLASHQRTMSDDQALTELQNVPMSSNDGVSAQGLVSLLNDLQESGQVKLNSGHNATSSGPVDLTQLMNIFSMLQGGGTNSLLGLAQGLMGSATSSGSTPGKLKFDITTILALLQAAAPIIAMIAPQYAPIIQALVTILPVVITFIQMFKKPSPTPAPSAMLFFPSVAKA